MSHAEQLALAEQPYLFPFLEVEQLPPGIRGLIFTLSLSLNSPSAAIKYLQRIVNVVETGVLCPGTHSALKSVLEYRGVQELMNDLVKEVERTQVNGTVHKIKQFYWE